MKKLTVTIGIPAYNEEANIYLLLKPLLAQKKSNYILKEIIVVSDGSTDRTEEEVKRVKSKKINLFVNESRLGQAHSQNVIFSIFKSQIIVLLNADVLPADDRFVEKLLKPFYKSKKVFLVGSKTIPTNHTNFFEKVMNFSVEFKDSIFENWKKGNNLYMCSGRGRAFRAEIAKKMKWEESLSEDAYSYLFCKKNNFRFEYNKSSVVIFRSPKTIEDHLRQSARFAIGQSVMSKYFHIDYVKKEYKIPFLLAIQKTIYYFFLNPIQFFTYFCVFTYVKYFYPKRNIHSIWNIAKSSKKVI